MNKKIILRGILIYGLFILVALVVILNDPMLFPVFVFTFIIFHLILFLMDKLGFLIDRNKKRKFLNQIKEDFIEEKVQMGERKYEQENKGEQKP